MPVKRVMAWPGIMLAGLALWGGQRPLTERDVSYYRIDGQGETFSTPLVHLSAPPDAKKAFWTRVAQAKIPEVYQLHFKTAKGTPYKHFPPLAECVRQIDAWFAAEPDCAVCPEKIYGVSLEEENITWDGQVEIMNELAAHLKKTYGVRTFHWLSEPLKPTLALKGDGWIFDAYSIVDPAAFYAHVESFILMGRPVIPCLWASGHFAGYHKDRDWFELTRFTLERMDICRTLGLPVQVFAVAGDQGSVWLWFGKAKDEGEQFYRETVRRYLAAAKAGGRSRWICPPKRWRVPVARTGELRGVVDLGKPELVDATEFDDVHAWRLTERGLETERAGQTLTWRLNCVGRPTRGWVTLKHASGARGAFGGVPLAAGGCTRVPLKSLREQTFTLMTEGPIRLGEVSVEGCGTFEEDGDKPKTNPEDRP